MSLVTRGKEELSGFKDMEEDYKWILHDKCKTHGSSCGGSISERVAAGVFEIDESKVNEFCENFFNCYDEQPKKFLTSALKGLMLSDQSAIEDNYVDIKYGEQNVGKPITGGYFLMVTDESPMNGKRTFFFAIAQITKDPSNNHYFLQDYYLGKRVRVENALKYMLYEATKYRKFYIEDQLHSHVIGI
ncbi:hypothetical protein RhiirB3_448488 [Rhizophagus irregularis]|nr:hypothetical protein RhiirB3_448488 [Rhizophagus irregularis]